MIINRLLKIIAIILFLPAILFLVLYLSIPFTGIHINDGAATFFGLCAIAGAILLRNNK